MNAGERCRECGALVPQISPSRLCGKCTQALALERAQGMPDAAGGDSDAHSQHMDREDVEAVSAELSDAESGVSSKQPAGPARESIPVKPALPEKPGDTIGRYKLLEKVGEGGWGVVYVAEQTEPVRRRVALKVIKPGMDTKAVVARFEAERQALAMMDHPNIAKVLDAGATGALDSPLPPGRPYFVMELVRGIKITEYCDQNNLPTNDRLELFIKICQAIQHAHQKGIIHRDIKPSNVLVTLHDGVPVPKIIDFGIAKATESRLTDATVYTQLHQFIGTPAYMSPEQAEMSGLDIDTRSDIYSLGVMLYELLTGRTPFDPAELLGRGIDAMRKTIREKEPMRPSTKLATLRGEELTTTAKRRSVESSELVNLLRGDLDWIVMKCLEKDRTRRYETANGLARDVERHLNDEPIVARPATRLYRFQKIVRRNRLAFAAMASVGLALVLGTGVSIWQAVRAKRAQALAIQTRGDAEKLSNFILEGFYAELEPTGQFDTVTRLARQAVAYYDGLPATLRTSDTDRNRAMAQARLALVLARQGDSKTAMPIAAQARAKLEELYKRGDTSEGTTFGLGLALFAEAWCYRVQADVGSQLAPLQRGVEVLRRLANSPDGSRRVKLEYANLLDQLSSNQTEQKAMVTREEALRILAGLGALDFSDLGAASDWADIADSEARQGLAIGRIDDAERLEKQAQRLAEGVLARRPDDLHARLDLAQVPDVLASIEVGRFHEAAALELASNGLHAAEDYFRFNPSDQTGWQMLVGFNFSIASLLFREGRVVEALNKTRATVDLGRELRNVGRNVVDMGFLWLAIARWEAQRGNRASVDQALLDARNWFEAFGRGMRVPEMAKGFWTESVDDCRRWTDLAAGQDAAVRTMSRDALAHLDQIIAKLGDQAFPVLPHSYARIKRRTFEQLARASLNLKGYAEAEAAARALVSLRSENEDPEGRYMLDLPFDRFWGNVLLAQASTGQGRKAEALTMLEPALAHYHDAQARGAGHVSFRQHFARALYVQALAEPADADGAKRRRDELDQAARLLEELTDEARQLHDSKELLAWITIARTNLDQGGNEKK